MTSLNIPIVRPRHFFFQKALSSSSAASGSTNPLLVDSFGNGTDLIDPNPTLIPVPVAERTAPASVAPYFSGNVPPPHMEHVGESSASCSNSSTLSVHL